MSEQPPPMSEKPSRHACTGTPWHARVANDLTEALDRGVPVYVSPHPCERGHQSVTRVIDGKCAACAAEANRRRPPNAREIESRRQQLARVQDARALARELAEVWQHDDA